MNTGCLILAGGKSRRMGYRKSSLRLNGTTFLDKLIFELRDFPEILVSVDDAARHPEIPYSMIDDRYSDCGPMSGLTVPYLSASRMRCSFFPVTFLFFPEHWHITFRKSWNILIRMHLSVSRQMNGSTPVWYLSQKLHPCTKEVLR